MAKECKELLGNALKRFFINRNTLPSFLHIVEHCFEALVYLIVLHSPSAISELIEPNQSTAMMIAAIFIKLIILRATTGVSFIKIFYPVVLALTLYSSSQITPSFLVVILVLMGLLLVVDLLSNVALDFSPTTIHSETLNLTKFFHLILFLLAIIQSKSWNNSPAFLICGATFGLLALLKGASVMRNDNFKQVLLRIYLILCMANLTMALHLVIALPVIVRFLMPILLSQFVYQLSVALKKRVKIDELYSQQKYFELSFEICKYTSGEKFSRNFQHDIQNLVGRGSMEFIPRNEKLNLIYQKLIDILNRKRQFQDELLLAEIHIVNNHRLLKARYLVQRMKANAGLNFIQRILVHHLEQMLAHAFNNESSKISFDNEESYTKCDKFRSLLLKAATHHINFWYYSRKNQIQIRRFREMADKILEYQDRIVAQFQQIEVKCITISLIYVSYLFRVAREISTAKKILEDLSFNEENEVNFQLNQRVFIQVDLENPFKILKIGHNVSLLLGFERKDIEGQQTEMFLPDFFKKFHKQAIQMRTVEDELASLHLLNKKVIIKNKWNFYRECNLILRLHHTLGQAIIIQGFLHIRDNPQYIWSDYLFIDDNEDIIECSDSFSEIAPASSRKHKASEFFVKEYHQKVSNYNQNNEYFPLVALHLEDRTVTYFVRRESRSIDRVQMANQNLIQLSNEVKAKLFTFDPLFFKKYYQQMKQCLNNIYAKEYVVVLLVSLLLLVSIFAMELLFYTTMNHKQNSQNLMINRTSDLIQYANNYTEISIMVNYLDLQRQINYSNNFTNSQKIVKDALSLQLINQRLKYLSIEVFQIPSANLADVGYTMSTFQITLEYVANAYMLEKFKNDDFMVERLLNQFRKTSFRRGQNTYFKIKNNYLDQINAQPQQTITNNIVLIVLILLALIATFLLNLRSELHNRVNQQQGLTLVLNCKYQQELITAAKGFVLNITSQEVKTIKNETFADARIKIKKSEETSFAPDVTVNDRENLKSEVSMRELSNRNLMDETVNKSLFITSKQGNLRQEKDNITSVTQIQMAARKKRYLVLPLVLIGVIAGVLILNLVQNGIVNTIDEKLSAQNIFDLFTQTINLSRRTNNFLNYLNLKLSGAEVNGRAYSVSTTDFSRIQTIVNFDETSLSEFASFQTAIINLQYYYICTFVDCDPRFRDEINIIYTSTIEKVFKLINSIISSLEPLEPTAATTALSSSTMKFNLDLIFYTEMVIRITLTELLDKYDECYLSYSDNLLKDKQIQIAIAISFTVISTVLFVLFAVSTYRNQRSLARIVDILKVQDYYEQMVQGQGNELAEIQQ